MAARNTEEARASRALSHLWEHARVPSFGGLAKADLEVVLVETFIHAGRLNPLPSEPELMRELGVTRAKARAIRYRLELRANPSDEELDLALLELLLDPIVERDGDRLAIDVDRPRLLEHLRERAKRERRITDGSFSASLVRLSADSWVVLVEALLAQHHPGSADVAASVARQARTLMGKVPPTVAGILQGALAAQVKRVAGKGAAAATDSIIAAAGRMLQGRPSERDVALLGHAESGQGA